MATFPLIRFDSLPLSTSDGSNASLVAVIGNTTTVRIRWVDLTAKFAILTDGEIDGDVESDFAIKEDGIFSRHNTVWGKSPRYKYENWGDLTKDTRFLRVDSTMNLTEDEIGNARKSLNIQIANHETPGIILGKPKAESFDTEVTDGRLSNSVYVNPDGSISLPAATHKVFGMVKLDNEFIATDPWPDQNTAVTGAYVHYAVGHAISKLWRTPATNTSIGMVMGGTEPNSVNVDPDTGAMTVPLAITPGVNKPGLTYLAHGTYQSWYANKELESSWAAPASLVEEMVEHKMLFHQIPAKYNERLGAVMPTINIVCGEDGDIYVQSATTSKDGVVVLAPHQFDNSTIREIVYYYGDRVPDIKSVHSFIKKFNFVTSSSLSHGIPIASTSAIGGIKASSTVYINDEGSAYVPNATHHMPGVCKVFGASGSEPPMAASYHQVVGLVGPASEDSPGTVKVRGYVYKGNNVYPSVVSTDEFDKVTLQAANKAVAGLVKVKDSPVSSSTDYVDVPSYVEFSNSLGPATVTSPGRVLVSGNIGDGSYPVVPTVEYVSGLNKVKPVGGEAELFTLTGTGNVVTFSGTQPNVRSSLLYYRLEDNAALTLKANSTEASNPPYNKVSYGETTANYSIDFDIVVETKKNNTVTLLNWVLIDIAPNVRPLNSEYYSYRYNVKYDSISNKWVIRLLYYYSTV